MLMTFLLQLGLLFVSAHKLHSSLLSNNKIGDNIKEDARASTLKDSCWRKCGVHNLTTCSCDVRCQINRNCCHDFQTSCPTLFDNFMFTNLIRRFQECDSSGYLLISRCPVHKNNQSLNYLLNDVDADIVTSLENISEGHGAVNRLFSQVPVTDLDSGFTFKNVSVYLCNDVPGSNLKFWDVYIDNFNIGSNGVLKYDEISRVESKVFLPSKLEKNEKLFRCYFKDKKNLDIDTMELNKTKSLDFESLDSMCVLCYPPTETIANENQSIKEERLKSTFLIKASFENNEFIFQAEPSYFGEDYVPWKYMQCSNVKTDKDEKSEDEAQCSIISCIKEFEKTSDGQCKSQYIIYLAVPDDNIPMTRLFLSRLSSYFECYLNKYAGYDLVDKWQVAERFFDDELQKTFFVTPLLLYSTRRINIFDIKDAEFYYSNFIKAIHILRSYRSILKVEDSETSEDVLTLKTFDFRNPKKSKLFANVATVNTIPVCAFVDGIYLFDYPVFDNLRLQCIYIPAQDTESNGTRAEADTDNNTCLSFFTFSAHNPCSFSAFFLIYLLLVWLLVF